MSIALFGLAALFGLFTVGFGIALLAAGRAERALTKRGVVVQGAVMRLEYDGDGADVPVVRFAAGGAWREVRAAGSMPGVRGLAVGTTVPIRYLPDDPSFARIDVISERHGQTIGFGIGVGLCAVLSLLAGLGAAAVSGWL